MKHVVTSTVTETFVFSGKDIKAALQLLFPDLVGILIEESDLFISTSVGNQKFTNMTFTVYRPATQKESYHEAPATSRN